MNALSLAWRNVWRNQRRSLVTIGAMVLALITMIAYAALVRGYLDGMARNVLDLEVGDIQIHAHEYRETPSLHTKVDTSSDILAALDDAGYAATSRTLASGLAAAGDNSAGVSLRGVDVARDATVSDIHEHVEVGQWLDPADPHGVVVGVRLARILGISPGDELIVLSQAADGGMANEIFKVRGILKSVAESVDRGGVYMTMDAFRELMSLPEGVHQLIIRTPDGKTLLDASAQVKTLAPDLEVMTWRELMPMIASMFDTTEAALIVLWLIVTVAVGIVLLNAMLMAVFERIREFGVLKALGVGPWAVLRLILLEVGIMTTAAILVGLTLSVPMLWYLSEVGIDLSSMSGLTVGGVAFDPIWRATITPQAFVGPVITLSVIVGLATLPPALRAAFIRPVEAMRHQ